MGVPVGKIAAVAQTLYGLWKKLRGEKKAMGRSRGGEK